MRQRKSSTWFPLTLIASICVTCAGAKEEVGVLVEHIELDQKEATRLLLATDDPVTLRAAIGEHLRAGSAKVIDVAYLLGTVGQEPELKSVIEYMYPTEWDPMEVVRDIQVDVTAKMDLKTAGNPTAFDVRDLGNTLSFTARRGLGNQVYVELANDLARLSKIRQWGADELGIVQPEFAAQRVTAKTHCTDQRPILLGMYSPRGKGDAGRRVFAFATPFIRHQGAPVAAVELEIDDDPFGSDEPEEPEEALLPVLGVTIGVEFIEVEQSHLAALLDAVPRKFGESSGVREQAEKLIARGEAKLLSSGTLRSVPGQRAKTEPVREFIYPTEYDPPEVVTKLTPEILANGEPIKTSTVPTAFDARLVGMAVEAEASVVEMGGEELVDLDIAVDVVDLARHIFWGIGEAKTKHPIFNARTLTTQFQLKPGDDALAGIYSPRKKEAGGPDGRRVLVFVWAELARAKK